MSVFTNKPFSRLWHGRSRSNTNPNSADFVGDAAPPFAELTSGSEPPIPTTEELARIRYYHSRMTVRDADFVDMDLTHERRRLICAGRLFRTDSTFERKGMYELFVLLFDNYLVITQVTGTGSDITFQVHKRPIPLDLLRVETDAIPTHRKGSIGLGGRDGSATFPPESWGVASPTGDHRAMLPLVIYHDGRLGGTTRLFAESEDVQSTWKSKLEEAILLRQQTSRVFEMSVVAREELLTMGGVSSDSCPPETRSTTRTITCATPFVTHDGRTLLAIGCTEGLWIGNAQSRSFGWVLRFPIQQCAVVGEYGLIIVISNGELRVYDLEVCVPKSTGRAVTFSRKTLETKGKPYFFRVGKLNGEMYIVAAVKKHMDTIFYVWEAVTTMGPDGPLPDPQEFRLIHNFFLPVECSEAIFLRTKLCILHNNGFNLVKLPELLFVDVPQSGDQNASECKKLIKRCSSGRPLSMTRVETEVFILCYDKFGLYVDRHGVPLLDRGIVEWEGQADRASFRFPYVLLFCSAFVEVRNLITGHLTQIFRPDGAPTGGNTSGGGAPQMRCLWDGRGGARSVDYDLDFGVGGDGGGSELPTVLGVADLPTTNEWGAQSSSVLTQQCVFTLFSPVPPPYSLVEEPAIPYDANSII